MIELSGDGTNIGGALDESVAELKVKWAPSRLALCEFEDFLASCSNALERRIVQLTSFDRV